MQADTNEVMAASVVYLSNVDVDRPLSKAAWNNSQALRHFSVLRKLDGVPFPAGGTSDSSLIHVSSSPHFDNGVDRVSDTVHRQHADLAILRRGNIRRYSCRIECATSTVSWLAGRAGNQTVIGA